MMIVLNILKIIGIILLCILGIALLLLCLVLFVPIRYRLKAKRVVGDEVPVRAEVMVTWLLHFISASFLYPEQTYLKVKLFGIPVFSTKPKEDGAEESGEKTKQKDENEPEQSLTKELAIKEAEVVTQTEKSARQEEKQQTKDMTEQTVETGKKDVVDEEVLEEKLKKEEEEPKIITFFVKLWEKLKNIQYTIRQIYDKIKHVINNIRYYVAVIQSNCFKRTFALCKTEVFSLLASIMPRKIKGDFTIGTGDPASTAQVLAIHGMLYPLIGNDINITPDFENSVIEGDFFLKGKITVFKVLKTAIKVYFNRDMRKVIRLLKREAA